MTCVDFTPTGISTDASCPTEEEALRGDAGRLGQWSNNPAAYSAGKLLLALP